MQEVKHSYICCDCGKRVPVFGNARFLGDCDMCNNIHYRARNYDAFPRFCPVCFSPWIIYNFKYFDARFLCSNLNCSGYSIERTSRQTWDISYHDRKRIMYQPGLSAVYLYSDSGAVEIIQPKYLQSFAFSLGRKLNERAK